MCRFCWMSGTMAYQKTSPNNILLLTCRYLRDAWKMKTRQEYMLNVLIVWGTYREPWLWKSNVSTGRKEVACMSDMIFPAGICRSLCHGCDEGRRCMVVNGIGVCVKSCPHLIHVACLQHHHCLHTPPHTLPSSLLPFPQLTHRAFSFSSQDTYRNDQWIPVCTAKPSFGW